MQINLTYILKLIILFIIFFVIALIIFTVYRIVKPEKNPKQNYQSFPHISLKNLPEPNIQTACDNLKQCTVDNDCIICGDNFQCVDVENNQKYHYKGFNVPKGKWCLPKISQQSCNLSTGKWVWSYDTGQNWKCQCKYPNLYNGDDCTQQVACLTPENDQPDGKLVGSVFNKTFKDMVWDPINPDDKFILTQNPNELDEKDRPKWVCECPKGYIRYPNDPYNCYKDPCCASEKGCAERDKTDPNAKFFLCETTDEKQISNEECSTYVTDPSLCTCKCNCDKYSSTISLANGQCIPVQQLCENGTYDSQTGNCICTGQYKKYNCINAPFGDILKTEGICKTKDNPIGQECVNVCEPNPCGFGNTCSANPGAGFNNFICSCQPIYANDANNKRTLLGYKNSDNCTESCYPKGTLYWQKIAYLASGQTIESKADQQYECCNGYSSDTERDFGTVTFSNTCN